MNKPNIPFEDWRPDEVAECVARLPDDLRSALWSFVQEYDRSNVCEDNPMGNDYPGEVSDTNKLPVFWDRLSAEHQATLRARAKELEAEWGFPA